MSITITTCTVKVPLKCILEMCLEHPELEELYEDLFKKADASKMYDLRFDGTDYFRNITRILRSHSVQGDVVLNDGEWAWAYRFHDGVSDYVTWSLKSKYKLKPIKNDNS